MSDIDEIPLAECQQYLMTMSDPDTPPLGENFTEKELYEIIALCKSWENVTFTAEDREIIPKYVAKTVSTMINSTQIECRFDRYSLFALFY